MSEDYIKGQYGRFFEYNTMAETPACPWVIEHIERGSPSPHYGGWVVPHAKIVESGESCGDRNFLLLNFYNGRSRMPLALESNYIAKEAFRLMKRDSTGFWLGVDSRRCGKWVFPNPSFVFFVKKLERDIVTSFRLKLSAGQKYMFIVSAKFTCIYVDIPRSFPPTTALTPGPGPTDKARTPQETIQAILGGNGSASTSKDPKQESISTSPSIVNQPNGGPSNGGMNPGRSIIPTPTKPGKSAIQPLQPSPSEQATQSTQAVIVNIASTTAPPTALIQASTSSSDSATAQILNSSQPPTPAAPTPTPQHSHSMSPSHDNETGDTASQGTTDDGVDAEPTIIDIQAGRTPYPAIAPTPPKTILEIVQEEDVSLSTSDDTSFDDSAASLCYPAKATVELGEGQLKRMDELEVGDVVQVGDEFSPVFGFTHRMPLVSQDFIELTTGSGYRIALTKGHFLYVNDQLRPAAEVRKFDRLRLVDGETSVERIEVVRKTGLYNPQTLHGDIVVNGVVASTYTTSVEPKTAHALLLPLRVLWNLCHVSGLRSLEQGSFRSMVVRWWDGISRYRYW